MSRVSKVKLKVNLSDIFGERVPDDEEFKGKVVQAVIDRIIERTQSGVDVRGRSFKPYSKEYAKKKGSSSVDLTLFGDMLATIDEIDSTSQTVTLGFPDETENAKAFNHNTGDTLPKREFFGIQKKELKQIASEFRSELKELKSKPKEEESDEPSMNDIIRGILSGEFDEDLGI